MNNPISKLELAIIDELKKALSSGFRIERFPDNPESFDLANSDKVALIHFAGSQYQEATDLSASKQLCNMNYAIHLFLRSLNGDYGSYQSFHNIKKALQGKNIEGGIIAIKSESLSNQDDGVWHWIIEIQLSTVSVTKNTPQPHPLLSNFKEK